MTVFLFREQRKHSKKRTVLVRKLNGLDKLCLWACLLSRMSLRVVADMFHGYIPKINWLTDWLIDRLTDYRKMRLIVKMFAFHKFFFFRDLYSRVFTPALLVAAIQVISCYCYYNHFFVDFCCRYNGRVKMQNSDIFFQRPNKRNIYATLPTILLNILNNSNNRK